MEAITAFVVPVLPLQRWRKEAVKRGRPLRRARTRCEGKEGGDGGSAEKPEPFQQHPRQEGPIFGRFDASSPTDAFGRDPKKETDFWKAAARNVLDDPDVRKAIEEHAKDGADGLTEEQRGYQDFLRKLDEKDGDDAGFEDSQ